MTAHATNWIELDGVVNVRDLGGLPAVDGCRVRLGALIRSASLTHMTEADVIRLVDERGVRRVIDLRTDVEVSTSDPSPLHGHRAVTVHHLSLYPDTLAEQDTPDPVVPWAGERFPGDRDPQVSSYLRYLDRRPDSVLAALRAIAEPDGATVVHCAAGKDRTGVVVALALSVAGVPAEVIAADYAETQSQISAILEHLARSTLYTDAVTQPEKVPPASAEKMLGVLAAIEEDHGGVLAWLAGHGWTGQDTERLRAKLLDCDR
ncbi:MAG TPA: tyrosine-protein phosphatase [Jatrophihabitans sp.]|nr:tyrosine-protein phosphatase [Jatrophihabitans sp.]